MRLHSFKSFKLNEHTDADDIATSGDVTMYNLPEDKIKELESLGASVKKDEEYSTKEDSTYSVVFNTKEVGQKIYQWLDKNDEPMEDAKHIYPALFVKSEKTEEGLTKVDPPTGETHGEKKRNYPVMPNNPKMKKLGARNYSLVSSGVNMAGTYDPEEILFYFEEQLYADQVGTIYNFLEWVHQDEENRSFGSGNYEQRFQEFLKAQKK